MSAHPVLGPPVTLRAARGRAPGGSHGHRRPLAAVAGHGLFAATTLVLVLPAALGVGEG
ncbi:hypothetical protein [Streptomyces sp. XD-27]|uniref:hypothetical protein n=1 Tax=Streptomyces sp. XD-27 TaxID=3062779 RepID=UPI0026F46749|nr:hypothetical protein [Streptomyces sp. XD-27]WKX73496.1 hypothetical protein Q3Y56_29605 [Streptomyces sp. XD-27]